MRFLAGLLLCFAALVSGCEGAGSAAAPLEVTSPAFLEGETIPSRHTCDGVGVSPPLNVRGEPAGTKSLALIADDPDAPVGRVVHWLIWGFQGGTGAIAEDVSTEPPAGVHQGTNARKKADYFPPCPPEGQSHRYYFKVFALDAALDLEEGASEGALVEAMDGHVLAEGALMGRCSR